MKIYVAKLRKIHNLIFSGGEKMKKSVKIALIAIVSVLVVAGAVTAAFWGNISNAIAKSTKTPEEYYVYVEESNLETTTSTFYSLLNLGDSKKEFKEGSKFSLKLEAGEGISDIANLVLGSSESIEWFKSIEFSGDAHVSNDLVSGSFKGLLNDKDIIDAKIIADMKNENAYISIPMITGDKFIKLPTAASEGEAMEDEFGGSLEGSEVSSTVSGFLESLNQETINNILPTEKVFAKLLVKYFNVLVDNLGNAETSSDTLEIGGVAQECTLITLKVDEIDFYNGIKAVLNEVKTDEEIEKIVRAYAAETEEDPDQLMDDFVKSVFFAIEEIDKKVSSLSEKPASEIAAEEVTLKTWVDKKGNVAARKIEAEGSELFFGNAKKGSELATEVRFIDEEQKVVFSGKGSLKRDKLSGNYAISVKDEEILKLNVADFDLGALEDDCELYGKFTISAGKDLTNKIFGDDEVQEEVLNLIKTAEIKFDINKTTFALDISANSKTIIKMTATESKIDYAASSIPEESKVVDATDDEALGEMIANFDVQKIIDKLVEAGVPQDLIDSMTAPDDFEDEWTDEGWGDFEDFEDFEDWENFEDFENVDDPWGEL